MSDCCLLNVFRTFFIPILLALIALGGTACTRGEQEKIHLTFWAMGAEGEHVRELISRFEKKHPDVRVKVQSIPWGAAHEKLLTAYAGQSTPDVCQLGNTWIAEFHAMNALYPLDSLIQSSTLISRDKFFEGVWKTNVINRTTYGIPWYVDTRVLFYREDVLNEIGYISPPKTWDEYLTVARKLKQHFAGTPLKYAVYYSLIFNDGYVPVILIMQNNGRFLKDHYRYAAFDNSATVDALRYYLTFFEEDLAPKSMTRFANLFQGFENADFSMMIHGPWIANELKRRAKIEGKWQTAILPAKHNAVSLAGGSSLIIFRNSPHKKAAWKLIEFLNSTEQQVTFYQLTRDLPSLINAWAVTELKNDRIMQAFYHQLQQVQPTPPIAEWEQIYVKLQEHLEQVIFHRATLPEAIRRLNDDVNRILEKRRWLLSQNLIE